MANIKKELCCKLCHGTIFGASCQIIDSTEKLALSGLNLNLDIDESDAICTGCSENLLAAFNFKVMCLETEDNITPYIHSANDPIDIKEIYFKVKDDKKLIDMSEDTKICRLCLQLITCEFKSVKEIDLDAVREYIPEINFVCVDDPILCKICFDSLHNHSTFLKNCLGEKENAQLRNNRCDMKSEFQIKSEEVVIKSEENDQRIPDNSVLIPKGTKRKFKKNESTFDQENKVTNILEQELRKFGCDECNYRAKHRAGLRQHKLVHCKEKRFVCGECEFKTTRKDSLLNHMKRHTRPDPVTQNESPQAYEEPTKTYKCDFCGFVNKYRSAMVKHMRLHTGVGVQIYKCDKCPFQTLYKQNLAEHNVLHLKPDEVKLHYCDQCDFNTKKKRCLIRHKLIHKDQSEVQFFQCANCDYKSIWKGKLREHVVQHLRACFKCELCSYKSPYENRLTRHFEKMHQKRSMKLTATENSNTV